MALAFWFLVSLSYSLYNAAAIHVSPPSDHLSFSLTYRDAEGSPLRSVEAILSADLPQEMPMRASVAAGRALRARLNMKRRPVNTNQPLLGRLSYAGERVGDFYLTVPVGTPPQKIIFLVDTGSEFILTQCSPCLNCTKTTAPSFAPQKSSSFRAINCNSPACIKSVGVTVSQDCKLVAGQPTLCSFATAYADGSGDAGFVSVDSFNLGPAFSKSFVFGCAVIVQEAYTTSYSGTMGLDAGPFSFPSQLFFGSPHIQKKFAYCLPDRMKSLNAAGTIKFGNYDRLLRMRYTPFAPPVIPLGSVYYFVELQGIKVGGSLIKVDKGAKGIVGGGGTIFDSGAALTHLAGPLYDKVVREMRRQTAHLGPFNASNTELASDLCYKVAASTKEPPKVPVISMHFAGGVDLELGPGSVLTIDEMQGDHAHIYFCFAFLRSSAYSRNTIGNYQTQNYWVEYDLDASTLGLAKANCAHVK